MTTLGKNLAYLRKLKGRTQDELAHGLGVKRSTYASWENDASEPRVEHLVYLCTYHRLPLELMASQDISEWSLSHLATVQRLHNPMQHVPITSL